MFVGWTTFHRNHFCESLIIDPVISTCFFPPPWLRQVRIAKEEPHRLQVQRSCYTKAFGKSAGNMPLYCLNMDYAADRNE